MILNHLYIFILIVILCTGLSFFLPALIVYLKRRERFEYYHNYKYFFPFFFSFTLLLFSLSLFSYSVHNIPDISSEFLSGVVLAEVAAMHLLFIYFPAFIHSFFSVPFRQVANKIFSLLSLISFTAILIFFFLKVLPNIEANKNVVSNYAANIFNLVFIAACVYSFIIAFLYKKNLTDLFLKKMALTYYAVSIIIFMTGIILEFFFKSKIEHFNMPPIQAFIIPTLYLSWTLLATYYSVQYYMFKPDQQLEELSDKQILDFSTEFIKKYPLTDREEEILQLIVKGFNNSDICDELSITLPTVKTHISNIFQKTGAKSRTELVSIFIHGS